MYISIVTFIKCCEGLLEWDRVCCSRYGQDMT